MLFPMICRQGKILSVNFTMVIMGDNITWAINDLREEATGVRYFCFEPSQGTQQ